MSKILSIAISTKCRNCNRKFVQEFTGKNIGNIYIGDDYYDKDILKARMTCPICKHEFSTEDLIPA